MKHLTDTIREALAELERMAGEPFGHYVYFPDQCRGEFVNNIDELCEDMTNDENHEVTPLFTAPVAQQPQAEAVPHEDWYSPHSCSFCGVVGGHARTCRRSTAPQQPEAVPPSWPTNAMIEAGRKAAASHGPLLGNGQSLWHIFRDMYAAAPQQAEAVPEMHDALCPALTGGDCTCTHLTTVDKAWAQFCGGIGRGPDAPYPGMIEAFESHYGQRFTDKDWREETGVWAAAWKAAKAHGEEAPQQAEVVPVAWDNCRAEYQCRSWCGNSSCVSHAAQGAKT